MHWCKFFLFENQKHNFTHENACHLFRTIVDSAAIPRRRLVRRSPRNIVIRCVREWLCKPPGIILATVLNSLFPGGSQGAGGDLRQAADTCFVEESEGMYLNQVENTEWCNLLFMLMVKGLQWGPEFRTGHEKTVSTWPCLYMNIEQAHKPRNAMAPYPKILTQQWLTCRCNY